MGRGKFALPPAGRGMSIGLLGGSFDPAHDGHVQISLLALKRLGLSQVWWLVSPQNPLKSRSTAIESRLKSARALSRHPRIKALDLESRLGTHYTADTLRALQLHYPGVRFVWLMGADNLQQIGQWYDWTAIFNTVPVAVFDRPGHGLSATAALAARRYGRFRFDESDAGGLAGARPPAWALIHGPRLAVSSTALRQAGRADRLYSARSDI